MNYKFFPRSNFFLPHGYRVFNGSWRQGGRYYGPFWQQLPKEQQNSLTIDGEAVNEHDFAQLHPRLLYAEFGLRLMR